MNAGSDVLHVKWQVEGVIGKTAVLTPPSGALTN